MNKVICIAALLLVAAGCSQNNTTVAESQRHPGENAYSRQWNSAIRDIQEYCDALVYSELATDERMSDPLVCVDLVRVIAAASAMSDSVQTDETSRKYIENHVNANIWNIVQDKSVYTPVGQAFNSIFTGGFRYAQGNYMDLFYQDNGKATYITIQIIQNSIDNYCRD